MELCVGGFVGVAYVLVAALLLTGGITFWVYWQDGQDAEVDV
jgi:hypothetical protein